MNARGISLKIGLGVLCLLAIGACSDQSPESQSQLKDGDEQPTIRVRVDYGGAADLLPPEALVYVFVRQAGSRMPLAVEQYRPADLPVQVGFRPEQQHTGTPLEVVARLSMNGDVRLDAEDVEVAVPVDWLSDEALRLDLPIGVSSEPVAFEPAVIRVRLRAEVPEEFPADTPVFLAARESSGMPVAVKRLRYGDLPIEVTLTDTDSMMKANRLSLHPQVTLVGRVSVSGQPIGQPGDWEGTLPEVAVGKTDQVWDLVIDTQLE